MDAFTSYHLSSLSQNQFEQNNTYLIFQPPRTNAEARKLCGLGYSGKIKSSPSTTASSFWTIHTNMFQTQSRIYFPQLSIAQYCTYRGLEFKFSPQKNAMAYGIDDLPPQNKSSPLKHTMAYGVPANPGICLSPCPSIETHKPARPDCIWWTNMTGWKSGMFNRRYESSCMMQFSSHVGSEGGFLLDHLIIFLKTWVYSIGDAFFKITWTFFGFFTVPPIWDHKCAHL